MYNENSTITLQIEGMDCSACATTITRTLEKNGLLDVHVDFVSGEAVFKTVPEKSIPGIVDSIRQLGYKVVGSSTKMEIIPTRTEWFTIRLKFILCAFFTLPLLLHMVWDNSILMHPLFQLLVSTPVIIIGFTHFGKSALGSLRAGVPNMDVLIFTGSFAAFAYSFIGAFILHPGPHAHHYLFFETGATIITLVLLGNLIEQRSIKLTASALGELYKLQEAPARKIIISGDKELSEQVPSASLIPGDICLVNTGDTIPADGFVLSGEGVADESMITGESTPVEKKTGEQVFKGTLLTAGNIKIRTEVSGANTILGKIIEMVKEAQRSKPKVQQLGDKVAAVFVPVVLLVSLVTFLVWKFIIGSSYSDSIMPALAVLVISCPCAMGLATPTAVMVGLGRAARRGILIKGGRTLEEFAEVNSILFDKTGTLTTGKLKVKSWKKYGPAELREYQSIIAQLEIFSSHPIAFSIVADLKGKTDPILLSGINEIKGFGMEGMLPDKQKVVFGSKRILPVGIPDTGEDVYLVINNEVVCAAIFSDELRTGAVEVIRQLNKYGLQTGLVSGDRLEKCIGVGKEVGINEIFAEKLPQEKLDIIKEKMKSGKIAMVGDGINDAPALTEATVGISIGSGTQIAIRSARIVLTGDGNLSKLSEAWLISKHTLRTIRQNYFWAFAYNIVAIPIAACGFLSPMVGALSMAFSDVIVIGNSIRLRSKKLRP